MDKGFQWEMQVPNGPLVRYTMNLTDKGEWREVGEVILEGRAPIQMMEMLLKKK